MGNRRLAILMLGISVVLAAFAVGMWLIYGGPSAATAVRGLEENKQTIPAYAGSKGAAGKVSDTGSMLWEGTGPMSLGTFLGQVAYDKQKDYYFLELRGARFPFKASPIKAQEVKLEAKGKDILEKNTSLLYGMLGEEVMHTTLLIDPDEEVEVMPAATDIARYIQMVNQSKFNGIAYTKAGGKLENSVSKGSQIQSLEKNATSGTPIIQIRGPKGGAKETRVAVMGDGKVIVEGKTYDDLYKAADLLSITLLKMLCGSPDCPDAAACATGGDCGCG